jgi:hypothetical protein
MSTLFLVEVVPSDPTPEGAAALLHAVDTALSGAQAQLIEAQVTGDFGRIFAITEAETPASVADALAGIGGEVSRPKPVRLVGADLESIKAARPEAGYLVEWDIPSHIDMDTYLARKKEKSPLYANVPEVAFLRTYVREDMAKCLCFYDAPDTDAVVRAREVVSTPIDRLHVLKALSSL